MTPETESFAWDEAKSAACEAARGCSFAYAACVFDDLRSVRVDDRFDYGEMRELAFGFVDGRGHGRGIHIARHSLPHHFGPIRA